MILLKHSVLHGKARSLWDLASLALLAIAVIVLVVQRGSVLAFSSSLLPQASPRPTIPTDSPGSAPVEATVPTEGGSAVVGMGWQRTAGVAVLVLGAALVVGGAIYLMGNRLGKRQK